MECFHHKELSVNVFSLGMKCKRVSKWHMVTQGYRQLCIFMYQIKILVLRRTFMMLLGLVKMVLGFRRESYLEQGMKLDGVDAANRMLEFIHKYGFVSSNSFY